MFKPLALYIGLRYTRAKRRNHFISFISLASMIGIALGVAVLITVLSVMNGFDEQIHSHFFAVAPEVTVMTREDVTAHWGELAERVKEAPGVLNSAPYINGKGMLTNEGSVSGVEVLGILPEQEERISQLSAKVVSGSLSSLSQSGHYRIVLGAKLASRLGLEVDDRVTLFIPETTTTPIGILPRFKRFTVSGIFSTKSGFGFDDGVAYINLQDAQTLFASGRGRVTGGLHVRLSDVYAASTVRHFLQQHLGSRYWVTDWTQQYGAFFKALAMEKTMMFVILLLIVAVATFNLVSTLVMVVNDKRSEIAILRTLGASPGLIMATFVVQGAVVGLVGTALGLLGGIVLALNATAIVDAIQNFFHVQFISSSVYFVDYLPSQLQLHDLVVVGSSALFLSLLATVYPAIVASKTQPAEALRYE